MIPLFDGLNETKFVDAIKMVRAVSLVCKLLFFIWFSNFY